MLSVGDSILSKTNIFWDFDGVIKDSVEVKSTAFSKLFQPFGIDVAERIRQHHETNGGMSRFDKLPIYLDWAGCSPTSELVEEYSKKFSTWILKGKMQTPNIIDAKRIHLIINKMIISSKKKKNKLIN